ncbi:pancreatic lipase-related protein 2-like [Periplaneta americana]|uniref:pancreatic lipase-related protein 2-like n=1 Tax=Periplaneta americana TaxID=6978 RepID=UPI0037E98BF0
MGIQKTRLLCVINMMPLIAMLLLLGGLAMGRPEPETDELPPVLFKLYTRAHPKTHIHLEADVTNLKQTDFNASTWTVVIVHGFTESHDSPTVQAIRDAYLQVSDLNVVVLDWWILARGPHYDLAAQNAKLAGRILANFLDVLINVTEGAARHDLHVVGFSLGAQVIGLAAQQMTTGMLPRITALDPAKPIFEIKGIEDRLDPSDAEFVQVIHTAGGFLSFLEPMGHADFYPNGGKNPQPSCSGEEAIICSHHLACMYFAESILRPMGFPAIECDSWKNFNKGLCDKNSVVFMGAFTPSSTRGKFFLKTNSKPPYGQGKSSKTAQEAIAVGPTPSNCSVVDVADGDTNSIQCAQENPHLSATKSTLAISTHGNSSEPYNAKIIHHSVSTLNAILIAAFVLFWLLLLAYVSFRFKNSISSYCRRRRMFK